MRKEITMSNTLVEELGRSLEHDSYQGLNVLHDTNGGVRQHI